MKYYLNNKSKLVSSLFILFLLLASQKMKAQINGLESVSTKFNWQIELKGSLVTISCTDGCGFTSLSFDSSKEVTLNENGMADLNKNTETMENSLFLIKFSKTNEYIKLLGIKGVGWKELNFSLKEKNQIFQLNELGKK